MKVYIVWMIVLHEGKEIMALFDSYVKAVEYKIKLEKEKCDSVWFDIMEMEVE